MSSERALIFDLKRDCSEDGPGIRTTVFFKGCPLACVWCQNPEGREQCPELSFEKRSCYPSECKTPCIEVCPENSLSLRRGELSIDRASCTGCNRCTGVCPTGALEATGYWIDFDDLMYRLLIDKPFYDSSGGGVTLSGGEVTQQMEFAGRLLQALQQKGIDTAIETSGFFNYRRFAELMLPWLDLVYFDLKLIDEAESRKYTGQTNRLILDNFVRLVRESKVPVVPRVPLIPGITTTERNLGGIARFLKQNGVDAATLLPYNPLWTDKAAKLGKPKKYERGQFMSATEIERCVDLFDAE